MPRVAPLFLSPWLLRLQPSSVLLLQQANLGALPTVGHANICKMEKPGKSKTKVRKSRSRGMRTKTGCLTCRKRHKKCDERRPGCGPCSISSRRCVYADAEPGDEATPAVLGPARTALSPSEEEQRDPGETSPPPLVNTPENQPTRVPSSLSGVTPNRNTPFIPGFQTVEVSHLPNERHHQAQHAFSPDTVSSELLTADLASTRWLDLLATDAAQADSGFSLAPSPAASPPPLAGAGAGLDYEAAHPADVEAARRQVNSRILPPAVLDQPVHGVRDNACELQAWQLGQDIALRDEEAFLFRTFTEKAAMLLDLFDQHKHFSTHATRLALRNLGLMKAILALTSRLATSTVGAGSFDASIPVQYYYETLHYVREALQYTTYTRSEELLATVIIISTYEMLDDSKGNWTRHLKGVFWIQRSQDVCGASGGLRQSVWWAWLQQDLWAGFREKRRCFSFWRPTKDISELTQDELARRAVYLLSQSVNFCADSQSKTWTMDARIQSGSVLNAALERWKSFLGPAYKPLPCPPSHLQGSGFNPIWIHPPQFAVAMQIHSFAKILIALHLPGVGGFQGYLQTQRVLSDAGDTICGIAMELKDEGCQILSAQCLFGAGLCTHDPEKREAIISLISDCEARTGWPILTLKEDLRAEWATIS